MAYNVQDVAKKILSKVNAEQGETISNLKLQKLLYYMQGYYLAYFGDPLFEEEIRAWQYGPVVPVVYDTYKQYGSGAIVLADGEKVIEFKKEEEEFLFDEVYEAYSQFSAVRLMNMTHDEEPWKKTKINDTISRKALKSFFKTKLIN